MVFHSFFCIWSRFFRVQIFLGPGSRSRVRVWVQVLEVAIFYRFLMLALIEKAQFKKIYYLHFFKFFNSGRAGDTGRAMPPSPLFFLRSKKKKGKYRKVRKTFKAETMKRLSLRSKLYCLIHSRTSRIQERLKYFSVFHGPSTVKSISPARP